jgi:hypothetical protein
LINLTSIPSPEKIDSFVGAKDVSLILIGYSGEKFDVLSQDHLHLKIRKIDLILQQNS